MMAGEAWFAVFGTGYWSRFQLAGWREVEGARCAALYNRTRSKAEALAAEFGVPAVYDDAEELLDREALDFVDIITDPSTHERFVALVAGRGLPVICQKPMAPSLEAAERMVEGCRRAGVPFFVHENWRWQPQIRAFKAALNTGRTGPLFRARIDYTSGMPVWEQQPFLKELEEFILADMGSHILDVARFLFGEARSVCCRTARVHSDLKGEDVATVMLAMESGATVVCSLAYAGRTEREHALQAFVLAEGRDGSAELGPDFRVSTTTAEGTLARHCRPHYYAWCDPERGGVHPSIVPCDADLLRGVTGGEAETTGDDNLKTVRLVYAAYESARTGRVVEL
jgi:predicted dehydrogenase